jgi:hypothetical protein
MFPTNVGKAFTALLLLLVVSWTVYDMGAQFGPWGRDITRLEQSDVVRLVEVELSGQIEDLRGKVFDPLHTLEDQYEVTTELTTRYNALQEKPHWRISYGDGIWTVYTGVLSWKVHDRTLEVEAPQMTTAVGAPTGPDSALASTTVTGSGVQTTGQVR